MTTKIESLWILVLVSKCESYATFLNLLLFLFLSVLALFLVAILYWAHPGGPAWGKHKYTKPSSSSPSYSYSCTTIPGPKGFPFIGSMNLMAGLAHHKLAAAAKAFGATRLMAFSLGETTRVIITCNPDVAKDILNSSVFADRPIKESAYSLMFNRAIGFAPYGVYWRTLRRIAATHLFCPKQIIASQSQRFQIAQEMVTTLSTMSSTTHDSNINVRDMLKRASLSNMMCSVFGRNYGLHDSCVDRSEAEELRKLVDEGYDLLGTLNWSDHLPWLSQFDPQKIRLRCSNLVPKVNDFVGRIISEHRTFIQITGDQLNRDFVDVLLSLQDSEHLSDSDMIAVLWEMIFRGTDTVAVLIEWVLGRVILDADVQRKVHDELDNVVGSSRAVTETDISSMVYLPAVIKEVLRLHPPGPLLSWARLAITPTTVDGFHVPAGTTAMVNMWAISRDPLVWEDPLTFNPDRFLDGSMDHFSVLGSDLRLAPFGSGRRTCPGKALGLTTVTFWVASLMHNFKWSSGTNGVDLSEVLKLSCEMASPLVAKVHPRPPPSSTSVC